MYTIQPNEKQAFMSEFNKLSMGQSSVSGAKARTLFMQSSLPPVDLAKIWELADTSKSGNLNFGEFCVAMKLIRLRVAKQNIPEKIPSTLLEFMQLNRTVSGSVSNLSNLQPIRAIQTGIGNNPIGASSFPTNFSQNTSQVAPSYTGMPTQSNLSSFSNFGSKQSIPSSIQPLQTGPASFNHTQVSSKINICL